MENDGLERFVQAQEHAYGRALREVKNGYKESHWMWYIFPQLRGLGQSPMSYTYGIAGREEARDYLAHPLLGTRLREITAALLGLQDSSAEQIFGEVDAMKLRSSMTLFCMVSPRGSVFQQVLERFFGGLPDPRTIELLHARA